MYCPQGLAEQKRPYQLFWLERTVEMAEEIRSQVTSHKSQVRCRIFVVRLWSLLFGLFLCSCSEPLYKNTYVVAGTYLEVTSPHKEAGGIVYEEFRRLQKIFDAYDADSELTRLNENPIVTHKVSKEMIEILELSQRLTRLTQGAFDVSCGSLYRFWKEMIAKKAMKDSSDATVALLRQKCGMSEIAVDSRRDTVSIKKEGVLIDLGSIAKGYIVDKAVARLRARGCQNALINAGGDIYCLGTNRGEPWRVGLRDPDTPTGILERYALSDEAIATSGGYEQFFQYNNRRYSHLIDPRTGYPVSGGISSVSVISDSCALADGLATALFVMGPEDIKKFLSENILSVKVFVIMGSGPDKKVQTF
jgi:thiamine biosynthesis lipoprotein